MAPRPSPCQIFAGLPDGAAVWLEVVYGLVRSKRRMLEIAAETPGAYFIRDMELMVLDAVNTAPQPTRPPKVEGTAKSTAA